MTELIKTTTATIGKEEQQTVNARDLHKFLRNQRQFSDWMKQRIRENGFVEGQDYAFHKIVKHVRKSLKDNKNIEIYSVEYTITLDTAKHLSMMERNEQGKKARRYFIEIEKEFRKREAATPNPDTLLATIYAEMERRIQAEAQRDEYRRNLERIARASNLGFGEISRATGLPKDIVIGTHCKSSKREHVPQYPRYIQLVLPLREIVEEYNLIGQTEE